MRDQWSVIVLVMIVYSHNYIIPSVSLILNVHLQRGIGLTSLVAVMHSSDWVAYSTAQDKIYFVNTQTQGLHNQ